MTYTHRISASIWTLIFSCMVATTGHAQTQDADEGSWLSGVEVSVDVVGPIQAAVSSYGQYEAQLRLNLRGRYFPVAEVGIGTSDHEDDGTQLHYKTSAPFVRIGCDFNVLKNKRDIYRLYIGFRAAYTSYKYDLSHPGIEDPVWGGTSVYNIEDAECSYCWAEALAGVQAKIAGPVHIGWSLRYRKRLTADEGDIGKSWYVPGYGTSGKSAFGATFSVIIVI